MLSLDEIRARLADRRLGLVADAIGVSRQTLYTIMDGTNKNPTLRIIQGLSDYLELRP